MNPLKTLQIINTILLIGVIVFLIFGTAKTESGEKVKFFPPKDRDRAAAE